MGVHIRQFDRDKALELIVYVAKHLVKPSFHSISKMLYLADKLHLQKYGRLICGDKYIAMEYGPVPSAIYDMMKAADGRASIDVDWDELIKEAIKVHQGRYLKASRECNTDLLAESEIECIEEAIHEHGQKSFGELTDLTHDAAWNETNDNQPIKIDSIVKTLPNADEVLNYLHTH